MISEEINSCVLGIYPNDDAEWNEENQMTAIKMLLDIVKNKYSYIKNVYTYVNSKMFEMKKMFVSIGFEKYGANEENKELEELIYYMK